jgi:hypothetical protein
MVNHPFAVFLKPVIVSIVSLLGVALLYGCAEEYHPKYFPPPTDYVPLDQIQIRQQFPTVSLSKENLVYEARRCVSTLPLTESAARDTLRKFPSKGITIVGHSSSSRHFVYRGQTGLCMEFSANKYPIFAAETFYRTANPVGVPPDVSNDWYKQIARQIAIKGQAKVIYVMVGKGNAYLVSYWNNEASGTSLYYSSEFKNAGEWENIKVDEIFSYPTLRGFSKTKRSGGEKKDFPLAEDN